MKINIYCDESCHLFNDHISVMTFGALQYPEELCRDLSIKILSIKKKYNCRGELKWTKVSDKNICFYLNLIDLYAHTPELHFRALVVHDKKDLQHDLYNDGDHDVFYYKMYFYLLRNIVEYKSDDSLKIYLDIKDTKSFLKVRKLHEVLINNFNDYSAQKIVKIQQIRSHESNILQLCDFLLGAVTFMNREPKRSKAKIQVAQALLSKMKYNFQQSTPPWETKFNLFHFNPRRDNY